MAARRASVTPLLAAALIDLGGVETQPVEHEVRGPQASEAVDVAAHGILEASEERSLQRKDEHCRLRRRESLLRARGG